MSTRQQDYKKSWNTLKAESGGRWCQPHPLSNELLTIGELMRNMERRASESAELATTTANNRSDEIASRLVEALAVMAVNWQVSDCNLAYRIVKDSIAQLRAVR